jgi:phage terminase large subunit
MPAEIRIEGDTKVISNQFPAKLAPLFSPAPYKVLWGGRDGIKSWTIARVLLVLGAQSGLRVLCARETQSSIADSVHALLSDQIEAMGLADQYLVQKYTITHRWDGTSFIFKGLMDPKSIKSVESCDILWVEEAQSVKKETWDTVLPTIRKEGSQVWVSFNPELTTDDTFIRFILQPPPGSIVIKTTYRDNPWLSERSRITIEHMKATDPQGYLHVYEGECRTDVDGAIFGEQMKAAEAAGNITVVPADLSRPVMTFWDLGFGDLTTVWFAQAVAGRFHVIDYLQGSGKPISDYIIALQNRKYIYGEHWLPHDCVDTLIHKKLASGDKSRSIEQIMRASGMKVRVAAKMAIHDRINATRTVFPQCLFDAEKCRDGLQALRMYQWKPVNAAGETPKEPLHNIWSHGADGFCTLGVSIKLPASAAAKPAEPEAEYSWLG